VDFKNLGIGNLRKPDVAVIKPNGIGDFGFLPIPT
jgi:hypothetical protein